MAGAIPHSKFNLRTLNMHKRARSLLPIINSANFHCAIGWVVLLRATTEMSRASTRFNSITFELEFDIGKYSGSFEGLRYFSVHSLCLCESVSSTGKGSTICTGALVFGERPPRVTVMGVA